MIAIQDALKEADATITVQVLQAPGEMLDRPVLVVVGAPGGAPTMAKGKLENILDLIIDAWQQQRSLAPVEAQIVAEVDPDDEDEEQEQETGADAGEMMSLYGDF